MEPSEESGGLPMEVDAWEKEASPAPASSALSGAADVLPSSPTSRTVCGRQSRFPRSRGRRLRRGAGRTGVDPTSADVQVEAVDECAGGARAELVQRSANEPEATERCGLGPFGGLGGEAIDEILTPEDQRDELGRRVRVHTNDDEESLPEGLGDLHLAEGRLALDAPGASDASTADERDEKLVVTP